MAESYRGLTIRIGGDTTSLQKALKTVNAATSDTDSALRKLSQALRLDPSNVQAMNLQMGYLADKAVNAGMKLAELRQAYERTANREILLDGDDSPRKLSEIAEETENVAMRAAHAQHEFNTLTESLARMHTRMTDLSSAATTKVSEDFSDAFKNLPTDKDGKGLEELAKRLKEIPEAIRPSSKAINEFTNTYASQVKKWEKLSDDAKKSIQNAFSRDLTKLISSGATTYSDKAGNTDYDRIAEDLGQIKDVLQLSDEEVADYLVELQRLKDAFPGASQELSLANLLQRMEDLRNETIKVEAMLKSTSQRLADMKAPSDVGKWLTDYKASLGVLTDEFSKFQSSVSTMGSVLKVDPTNTQAVAVALKSLSDASMNVDARIANVNEQLSKFDASKIEEASDYSMTAAQQLDEASKRAVEADVAYGEAAGAVEQARSQLDQMEDSASKAALAIARGEEEQQEATDADLERARSIVELINKMDGLEEAKKRAVADKASADADLEVAKERAEYEALTQELYKLMDQQNKVSESARKMGQAYAEALGKASITDVISDSVQQSIDAVGRALESANSRAGSFGSIAKVDPTNIQSAQKYLDALADSENVAKLKVDELSKALSDIDASGLSRVKSEFGNTDNAVAQTKQRVAELFVELGKSRSDLDIAISAEGMDDFREKILDLNEDLGQDMPESIMKARSEVARLEQAFDEAKAAEQEAARLNAFEGMQDSLAKTNSELDQMVVQRAQAIRDLVSNMQQAFSANLFTSAGDGASVFDATLSRCQETISRVNAELAQSPGNVDLIAEREQAVAEATDALRAKAELLNNTLGGMDASAMDEVVSRYGSVEEAVRETAITAASARQQLADFDSEIEALAQGGEGWDWVESFKALKLDVEGVSEPVRELYERYVQLVQAAEQSDMDAAMASAAQEVAHLKSEAADARAALLEMARTNVGDEIRESLETAIGEMSSSIQNLASAFDTLKGHMGSYGELLKFDPGNAEAMSGYLQSIASAERVATLEMQNISQALSELDTSRLEEFRADFDTAGLAVKEISDVMNSTLIPAVEDARAELSAAISAEGLDEYRDAIMAVGEDVGVELPENVARLRESLAEATRSLEEMKQTAKDAAEAEQVETLRARLASVAAELGSLSKARAEAVNGLGESLQKTASATMFSGVNAQLKTFDDTFKRAKSTIDSVNKALEKSPRNADLLAQKERAVEEATSALDAKTKLLRNTLDSIDAKGIDAVVEKYKGVEQAVLGTQQRVTSTQSALTAFNTQINALAVKLGDASWVDAFKRMELNVDECDEEVRELYSTFMQLSRAAEDAKLEAVFASAANAAQSYQDQLDAIPRTLEGLGGAMKSKDQAAFMQGVNMVSNWAERAGRQIIENANEIDTAYRNMRKTVDGTEEQFQKLYDSAIEFSKTHVTSADELLQMEALGGQVGIATDELERFAETASNLTIASDIDAEQAALSLGQMKNVLDLDIDGIERFSDSLVRLGNKMPATESSIMSVAQRIGSVATIAGMTAPDILAWSAAIASTGQRSESAGTAISKTLTEIQSAVEGGGKKLAKFASVAGQSAEQFAASWKANPTTALKEFIDGLANLDDAAITELENLGITGVRQKQALLGLAQTVENLDKALTESQSAWTVGGDAMEEARRKSEGFSGALQMLKNNLAAIWAEMAEGLDGPLNLIAQMLGTIAGVLNVLPTPLKMVLSSVVAAGTSLGVVVNVLKVLSPMGVSLTGMLSNLANTLRSLPNNVQAFVTSLSGGIFAIKDTTAAVSALNVATGSMMVAGIGIAIAAIAGIIGSLVEWHEHNELVRQATEGLADAVNSSVQAAQGFADGVGAIVRSSAEVHAANEEMLQSLADLGDGIRDARQELAENEGLVDAYANTIKELSGVGQLTSDQMEQLRNAVEKYNEITGAAIAITDEEHGTLNVIPDALDQITEAYKRNAEQKAKVSAYNSVLEEQAKIDAELAVAKAELTQAEEEYQRLIQTGMGYGEAMGRVSELKTEIEDLTKAQETLSEQAEVLGGEIESVESPITDLETLAVSLGYTLDQLASLSEDDMAKLKAAFQRSVPEAQRLLEQLMSTASGVSSSVATMSNLSKEEIKELAVEMKRVQEDAYKERKRELDAEYDAIKRAHDNEYNEAKRAYDAIYNERKRELDNEYDAAKKAYDKIYDERKKSLDKEYDAVKKAYDKIYEAKKKELDASYDAAKKAYDKRYKEIKKGYDDEYDAAKKASDSYLKDFKKAQEEETKAFKKETDERIKAIDKEYEAKQKLIEDETNEAVAGVQGEIDDIKARKRARQVEKENRERERIAAELVANVNKAHTTKQREKAEKAYYDQIAEWEEEDLERREDAEIEALEAKKDALKDEQRRRLEVLKESRDAAVDLYKQERDAQLEILQQAQQLEYDKQKELEEAKLETLKESHEQKLEMVKESNDAELAMIKASNDATLAGLKETNDAALTALKDQNDAILKNLKDQNDTALKSIKDNNDTILEGIKYANDDALRALKQSNDIALEGIKQSNEDTLTEMKRVQEDELKNFKDTGVGFVTESMQAMQGIAETVGTAMQTTGDKLKSLFENSFGLENAGKNAMGSLSKGMADGAKDYLTPTAKGVATLFHAPWDNAAASNEGKAFIASIAQGYVDGMNLYGVPAVKSSFSLFNTPLENLATAGESSGKGMVGNLANGIVSGTNEALVPSLNGIGTAVSTSMQGMGDGAEDQGKALPYGAAKGISSGSTEALVPALNGVNNLVHGALSGSEENAKISGSNLMRSFAKSVSDSSDVPLGVAEKVGTGMGAKVLKATIEKLGEHNSSLETSGANMIAGLNKGIVDTAKDKLIANVDAIARRINNAFKAAMGINSPSKVYMWFGQMMMSGLNMGIEQNADGTYRLVEDVSDGINRAFDPSSLDLSDVDLMQQLIDNMRSKEGALAAQAERMSQIVEDGFDPNMTVDAAFEAIDRIDTGKAARQQLVLEGSQQTQTAPVINMTNNWNGVTVRDEADIDRISAEFEKRMRRILVSQIG